MGVGVETLTTRYQYVDKVESQLARESDANRDRDDDHGNIPLLREVTTSSSWHICF